MNPVRPTDVGKPLKCMVCEKHFLVLPDGTAKRLIPKQPAAGAPAAKAPAAPAAAAAPAAPKPAAPKPAATAPAPKPAAAAPKPAAPAPAPKPAAPQPAPKPAAPAPAPKPAATPAAKAPAPVAPAPAAKGTGAVAKAPAPAAKPSAPAASAAKEPAPAAPGTGRLPAKSSGSLNSKQEEARKSMSQALSDMAAKAEKAVRDKPSPAAAAAPGPRQSGRKRGPIAVVGSGDWGRRDGLMWLGVIGALLAVVAIGVFIARQRSPLERAFAGYTAPIDGAEARTPLRLKRIQERAWLSGTGAVIEAGSVSFGAIQHVNLAAATPVLAETVVNRVYLPTYDIWAPSDAEKKIALRWKAKRTPAENIEDLSKAGIEVITRADLLKRLSNAGLDNQAVEIVTAFVIPSEHQPQNDSQRIAAGELPPQIDVVEFTGKNATGIINTGRKLEYPNVPKYQGRMLRFVGTGWPPEWRVFDLHY